MSIAAADVSCYQAGARGRDVRLLAADRSPDRRQPDNLWYRFIVSDGTDTAYYADDTPALDGGLGAPTDEPVDQSWALMQYVPGVHRARVGEGRRHLPDLPRPLPQRVGAATTRRPATRATTIPSSGCPGASSPEGSAATTPTARRQLPVAVRHDAAGRQPDEGAAARPRLLRRRPQGRRPAARLPRDARCHAIYFNPIFDAGSNHGYDTQDYTKIDPYFGTQKDFDDLVKHAKARGIRVILDGVFNHMSSDSPVFDRYHHYSTTGACESPTSAYRSWFTFHDVTAGTGTCVPRPGSQLGDLRRLVRVRLDPRADEVGGGGPGLLPHVEGQCRQALDR